MMLWCYAQRMDASNEPHGLSSHACVTEMCVYAPLVSHLALQPLPQASTADINAGEACRQEFCFL